MLQFKDISIESNTPVEEKAAHLRRLILKLRWIGMEDEAASLYSHLVRIAPGEGAGLWPCDTD